MLLNLLKNAWEAVPIPGGKISFSVIPENSGIRIDIQDNGCGISKEQQATIFQPFFTTKESGTGLGLAVSKQIAQAHSGDITLESAPGQGTVFHRESKQDENQSRPAEAETRNKGVQYNVK